MPEIIKANGKKKEMTGIKRSLSTHPVIFGSFAAFLVCAGLFFLLIVPAVRALEAGGSASVKSARERVATAQQIFDRQNMVIETLAAVTAEDRAKLDYALPPEPDSTGALLQMDALAKTVGAILSGIDFSLSSEASSNAAVKNVNAMDIAVNISGLNYDTFKIYLANVEKNLRIVEVRNFVFAGEDVGSLSLNLRTYYLK